MQPNVAGTLILDCGTMVGHEQRELELPKDAVPFFGLLPQGAHATYLPIRTSNGTLTHVRMIYRADNGMWRIEFTTNIPEISAGIIPNNPPNRRSDHAAVFTKTGIQSTAYYDLTFTQQGSTAYAAHFSQAATGGDSNRTRASSDGRNFGWY